MTSWTLEIVGFTLILTLGILGGLLPRIWSNKNTSILSYLSCFSGGLFFTIGLEAYHDATEQFEALDIELFGIDVPWAMVYASFAVLLVCIAEGSVTNAHSHFEDSLLTYESDCKHINTDHKHDHDHGHGHGVSPFVLAMLLSVHALFEGCALGSASDTGSFITILIAIASHKFGETLALGTSIVKCHWGMKKHLLLVLILSSATPAGQIIGIMFSRLFEERVSQISSAVFASLATGTFCYVSLCELLHAEITKQAPKKTKFFKFFFIFVGMVSVVVVTTIIEGGGHHHH
ncbi:hypothetical protein RCL1_000043 [Eukaryota sp. TZLM3-RCL]